MSDIILGHLIKADAERDAVHFALAPVTAGEPLKPGQHIGFIRPHNREIVGVSSDPIGIVDPFLEQSVKRGERFYMMLYQNTVTGMKHHWEHPSFLPPSKEESEQWMRELAEDLGRDYHWLLDSIADGAIYTGDQDNSGLRESEDIRTHYQNITGHAAPRDVYFRCAC